MHSRCGRLWRFDPSGGVPHWGGLVKISAHTLQCIDVGWFVCARRRFTRANAPKMGKNHICLPVLQRSILGRELNAARSVGCKSACYPRHRSANEGVCLQGVWHSAACSVQHMRSRVAWSNRLYASFCSLCGGLRHMRNFEAAMTCRINNTVGNFSFHIACFSKPHGGMHCHR